MTKRVTVIASGETERRAIPHLTLHLRNRNVVVDGVRIPPRQGPLNVRTAEKLVKAKWFENPAARPDKFVLLIDVDRKAPDVAIAPYRNELPGRLGNMDVSIGIAYAQQHLEAWYFADIDGIRNYLGRAPGHIDPSQPDRIDNPKQHLRNLLGDTIYTSSVSEGIAKSLDAETAAGRSPSFRGFLDAVTNGDNLARR